MGKVWNVRQFSCDEEPTSVGTFGSKEKAIKCLKDERVEEMGMEIIETMGKIIAIAPEELGRDRREWQDWYEVEEKTVQ